MKENVNDLIGSTFDYLTIVKRYYNPNDKSHIHWTCKCKCGAVVHIDGRLLKSNKFKSCGCANTLIGKRYGKLTVINLYKDNVYSHKRIWECKCECDGTYFAKEEYLTNGNRTHCGCIRRNSPYEDLTNQKFNKLTVLCRTEDYISPKGNREIRWLCKCACGNVKDVIAGSYDLKNGNIKSCGCYKKQIAKDKYNDITGQTFGYLTVRKREGYKIYGEVQKIIWICDCKCGNINIPVIAENLTSGHTVSCGCRQRETQFQRLYNNYDLTNNYGIGYTSSNKSEFFFDKEDFNLIKDYTWNETKDGYLISSEGVLLHRLVTNCDEGYDVDHVNHNKLDNRKEFLRITTTQQNCSNQKISINNTSGCTGVSYNSKNSKWMSYIGHNNQLIYLGLFDDINEAVRTRKDAEEKYFGEYSYENSMKMGGNIY